MINLQHVSFAYRKSRSVLEDVDLTLQAGQIYGLLGENGAGKSTLLKCLAGLVFPQKGEVRVMGHRPADRKPEFLSQLFFIPEEFNLPSVSIARYVRTYAPFYTAFDHDRFHQLLEGFDIDAGGHIAELSFGQRKKVFIAFGLATQTRLLIMDEPTNGLDIPSKSQFRKLMATALTDERCFVISTHQVRDLENLIDTLIILNDKRIALTSSVSELSEQFAFKILPHTDPEAIYSERTLHGMYNILPNETGEHTRLDMELFFKAFLLKQPEMSQFSNLKPCSHD